METANSWQECFLDSVPVGQLLKLMLSMKKNQIQNPVQKAKATFIHKQPKELSVCITCSVCIFGRTSFSQDPVL